MTVHTETALRIEGSPETIFRYAARVEDWPRILPHYRSVRVLGRLGEGRLVEMRARRGRIPVSWWALQVLLPDAHRIRYTHVRGVTRGMEVEWRITADGSGSVVAIVHDLALGWPLVGRGVADRVIGPGFVEPLAGATLRTIKALVEGGARQTAGAAPTV